jgi:Bacterial capsule synthesis protein PGA_cap
LMENGADLILMHHAHVLQGVQTTGQGKLCCYNLGNFLYDWSEGNVQGTVMLREQNEGGIFWFELDGRGVAQAAVLPTWIDGDCRVHWATGDRGVQILRRLSHISRNLEGDFTREFERQRAQRNTGPIFSVLAFHAKNCNWRYLLDALRHLRFEHLKMLFSWLSSRFRTAS